jgi:ParB family chromosome partitioning protein
MMGFMNSQSAAIKESEALKSRLAEFEGASPTRKLDPKLIRASAWANRHVASFADTEFEELKAEIASSNGNVQPIKVRPIAAEGRVVGPSHPPAGDIEPVFEIVYGHRRHRACLELGMPVLAMIEDISEQLLFVEMERENRSRKDLSAWEQGAMYSRALDQGLYPSNRKLAEAIGRDLSDVGKALALARLPQIVVEAFPSPLDLQYRWAKPLSDAQQKNPDLVVARALAIKGSVTKLSPKEIFEAIVGQEEGVGPSHPLAEIVLKLGKKQAAVVSADAKGKTVVRFEESLDDKKRRDLAKLIQSFLEA